MSLTSRLHRVLCDCTRTLHVKGNTSTSASGLLVGCIQARQNTSSPSIPLYSDFKRAPRTVPNRTGQMRASTDYTLSLRVMYLCVLCIGGDLPLDESTASPLLLWSHPRYRTALSLSFSLSPLAVARMLGSSVQCKRLHVSMAWPLPTVSLIARLARQAALARPASPRLLTDPLLLETSCRAPSGPSWACRRFPRACCSDRSGPCTRGSIRRSASSSSADHAPSRPAAP